MPIEAVIFDYGRTLHDPETDTLFPPVKDILHLLRNQGVKRALVSRGSQGVKNRWEDFRRFGLIDLFNVVEVVDQSSPKKFKQTLQYPKLTLHV